MKKKLTKKELAKILDESYHGKLLSWNFQAEKGVCSYKRYTRAGLIDICNQFGITINE